jgi:hypothetical protein
MTRARRLGSTDGGKRVRRGRAKPAEPRAGSRPAASHDTHVEPVGHGLPRKLPDGLTWPDLERCRRKARWADMRDPRSGERAQDPVPWNHQAPTDQGVPCGAHADLGAEPPDIDPPHASAELDDEAERRPILMENVRCGCALTRTQPCADDHRRLVVDGDPRVVTDRAVVVGGAGHRHRRARARERDGADDDESLHVPGTPGSAHRFRCLP